MSQPLDFLIIGQGLAGSLLALELLRRGRRVRVLDNGHRHASSTAAAGLVNPVTGKRLVKGTEVDECLPFALQRYRELEQELGQRLYHPVPMLRLFRSAEQWDYHRRRSADPAYADYLGPGFAAGESGLPLSDDFGGMHQPMTGYLDTLVFLDAVRETLSGELAYQAVDFDPAELELSAHGVRWRDQQADTAVFCEGYRMQKNPWFHWLPLQPAKGEIITLRSERPLTREIINAGTWLIPLADGEYRLGATNDWHQLDETPTEAAREELFSQFDALYPDHGPLSITAHRAGVRPASRDKRPFLGRHPAHPSLAAFNGFGARGSLLIPWHAARFADHLCNDAPLPEGTDIRRHVR